MTWAQDILPLGLGLAVVAGILATALWFNREAEVTRRVFRRFVVNIALPLVVILGAPLVLVALTVRPPSNIWPAIIAGAVIAGGWLTTAIFSELGKAQAKAEKLRDFHKALYAEIGNALQALWDEGASEAHVETIIARMREDADFVPFIPREHHDHIYDAVVGEIEVLPRQTIDAIVAYYALSKSIAALAEDMRGETYKTLPQARRIPMYEDYWAMREQAFRFGQYALGLIQAYSNGGAAGAEAYTKQVNTPAEGPSVLSRGSA